MTTILLIGDDTAAVQALDAVLHGAGFAVAVATPGRTALDALDRDRFGLVVLDLPAPGSGPGRSPAGASAGGPGEASWAFARRLCQATSAPVIVLGARATEDEALAAFEVGATDYLRRPPARAELVARVRAVLRRTGRDPRPGRAA